MEQVEWVQYTNVAGNLEQTWRARVGADMLQVKLRGREWCAQLFTDYGGPQTQCWSFPDALALPSKEDAQAKALGLKAQLLASKPV